MKVKFWGVRGSVPVPLTNMQLQRKISAVVQRIEPEDLVSPEARELFISKLPDYIFTTVGGNTTCVEVMLNDGTIALFDAGTGIREFGISLSKQGKHIRDYHVFFSHFHWDHIQGLLFFSPQVFNPECSITFYSPVKNLKEILSNQMKLPYFPITIDQFRAKINYVTIPPEGVTLGNAKVTCRAVNHPGGCYAYKITENDKSLVFSTDTELREADFIKNEKSTKFFENTDLLIIDSQYTLDEALEKHDWGHTSFSLGVEFASEWMIKKVVLFHHEPLYEDKKVYEILEKARWYANNLYSYSPEVILAREGLEIEV
ncbi:MAG: MBL fold metallo-hydrolase [Spirochaetaceae bacterium]|nr:MBL fold metallo-hydrolase [Spirochaetaceae bacterium]